jgi:FkbM family methyltransferase
MSGKLHFLYRAYRYRLRVDPAELRFVCAKLQPGDVAVDVGCHKGAYTYWMRRCVGPTGKVYAFEPQPRQVDYLRHTFAAMRYENVTLVPMGVSSTLGELQLHIPTGAGMTHAATFEHGARNRELGSYSCRSDSLLLSPYSKLSVPVTTLDAFFADQPRGPDFLKIDVEGHESAVFEGARETLETHRPTILLECEARHRADGDVRPVFEFLQSLGYEGGFFHGGHCLPLSQFDPAVHQQTGADPHRLPRGYVNNFAFEKYSCGTGRAFTTRSIA